LVLAVGSAYLLAALLKGPRIAARTMASEGMGFAYLDNPAEQAALEAARTASSTLKSVPVCLVRFGETEDHAASDLQAYLYVDGELRQRLAPGLALARSPQILEDLLIHPDEAEAALARSVNVTKLTAAEAIGIIGRSLGAREMRKRRRGRKA
jgi:hypothetical protein